MEVLTCKSCGKIFNHISGPPLCPACVRKLEDKFTQVKKYVYEHPRIGINELSQEMEVSIGQINRWIREERLCFSDDSPIGISCESCGTMIKTGRFCNACKSQMMSGLSNAAGLNKRQEEARKRRDAEAKMRFLDNN